MTAKLELVIQAGKVEMRIHSSSQTEEQEAKEMQKLIEREVRKIKKKIDK